MWVRNRYCSACNYRMSGYAKCFTPHDLVNLGKCCPDCGSHEHWEDFTEKWESESIWWNPLSWFSGHWIRRESRRS